jgi:gamma-glutamylcyclotransferase (GGCT)/AIG2-like uncharacterized protein YtfP
MHNNFVAVYGTLRKGYGLNRFLSNEHAEYLGEAEIKGFKLYAFNLDRWCYPVLTRTDNMSDTAIVELYKFHDNVSGNVSEGRIDSIEYGAGYFSEEVEINGNSYKVYLKDDEDVSKRMHHIKSGDFNVYSRALGHGYNI